MIAEKIIAHAKITPEKQAIISNKESVSYKELEKNIMKFKEKILTLQLKKYEPIGLLMDNSNHFIELLCACELLGHPTVLLSTSFKDFELNYHLFHTGVTYVFSSIELNSQQFTKETFETLYILKYLAAISIKKYQKEDYICQFTSGTSGKSKGVIRTTTAVFLEIQETYRMLPFKENEVFLTLSPICHSYGLIAGSLLPLCYGYTLAFVGKFSVHAVFQAIKKNHVTTMFAVPFMYQMILDTKYKDKTPMNTLRFCFSAGAPLEKTVLQKFYDLTGKEIFQDYGSTETGVMTLNLKSIDYPDSMGFPVGQRQFKIIDEKGEQVAVNVKGSLLTKSPCDLRCYLYPEELNQNIKDDWISLGDKAYIDESGRMNVCGRELAMINVGGLKVDPLELENFLLEMPAIKHVIVVGKKHKVYGEVVKAVIVKEKEVSQLDILNYCQNRIAAHKIPKIIEFVEEITKTTTGKIVRKYF